MKYKYKLIDYFYDENAGVSIATIQNKYGYFTGFTKIKEQDKDNQSSIAGLRFAEQKAVINSLKSRLKTIKIQIKTIKDYYNSAPTNTRHYNRVMRQLQKQKEELEQEIKDEEQKLQDDIAERDRTLADFARLKKKKDKYKEGL